MPIPQRRLGIGYATLQAAAASGAASAETLSIAEVDRSLALIATIRGAGSAVRRAEALRDLLRRAAMYSKSLGAVARAALLEGADALGRFELQLFSPVAPMLAQTAADVGEALRELRGEVAFEWKMDGARIQVHKGGEEVRIYTRALNDVTGALPEIVAVA